MFLLTYGMNKEKLGKASKKSCGGNRSASNNPDQKEKENNFRQSQIDQLSGFIDALADILVLERLKEINQVVHSKRKPSE